jgi:muramidase (phage lysozyme)
VSPNLKAFLDTIAWSEIGPALLKASDNGYNVIVGSTAFHPILFSDYSHHPQLHSMVCNSDAAGRYQFLGRYWPAYKAQLSLPDFGPESQDRWCIQLIGECRARDHVEAGRIEVAIAKCSRWESLPYTGRRSSQPVHLISDLLDAYQRAGGQLA